MKVCINKKYGGFSLSGEGEDTYAKLKGIKLFRYKETDEENVYVRTKDNNAENYRTIILTIDQGDKFIYDARKEQGWWYSGDIERDDKALVEMVEKLGTEKASGRFGKLVVIEIPDDIQWHIEDYDGRESIHEDHRSW